MNFDETIQGKVSFKERYSLIKSVGFLTRTQPDTVFDRINLFSVNWLMSGGYFVLVKKILFCH